MSGPLNMWALGGAALVWMAFTIWTIRWLSIRARAYRSTTRIQQKCRKYGGSGGYGR
jgi:hypothetical protein